MAVTFRASGHHAAEYTRIQHVSMQEPLFPHQDKAKRARNNRMMYGTLKPVINYSQLRLGGSRCPKYRAKEVPVMRMKNKPTAFEMFTNIQVIRYYYTASLSCLDTVLLCCLATTVLI